MSFKGGGAPISKKIALVFCFAGLCFFAMGDRYSHLERFAKVLNLVGSHYFLPVPVERLVDGAIRGLLWSLDPHSQFLRPGDLEHLKNDVQGSFSQMGFVLENKNRQLTVTNVINKSPAHKAGIRIGDRVIAIDGQATKRWTVDDFILFLEKNKGRARRLRIRRKTAAEPLTFHIKAETWHLPTVISEEIRESLFYLRVFWFSQNSLWEANKALRGKPAKGLILDLRGNPGGIFQQAVGIADLFLDKGLIAVYKIRTSAKPREFRAHYADTLKPFPLIVLINASSASGAEVLAGALKDHRRAVIMGRRSFGKGSLQSVFPLRDGYALKLTVGEYQTPSGGRIHQSGIMPDIVIKPSSPTESANRPSKQKEGLLSDPEILLAFEELKRRVAPKVLPEKQGKPSDEDGGAL